MSYDEDLVSLRITLKKIFALPISRLTYKQVLNAVSREIKEEANIKEVLEALLTGNFKEDPHNKRRSGLLRTLLEEFCIPVRVSKDFEEKGEHLFFMISENYKFKDTDYLVHRLKRVDGLEFQFITDFETTFTILEHFSKRVQEVKKDQFQEEKNRERLEKLIESLNDLVSSSEES